MLSEDLTKTALLQLRFPYPRFGSDGGRASVSEWYLSVGTDVAFFLAVGTASCCRIAVHRQMAQPRQLWMSTAQLMVRRQLPADAQEGQLVLAQPCLAVSFQERRDPHINAAY